MAGPLAIVGMGATVLGGVVGAVGAEGKGAADQAMYNYQAGVAQLNKKIALQNAEYTREAGAQQGYQSGLRTAQVVGQQKVAQSGSGIDVNTGSAKQVRTDTLALGEVDQQTIAKNVARRAYGYEVEAATKEAEAGADLVAGREARKAGDINAITSILGSVSSVSSKWLQGSQAGAFG